MAIKATVGGFPLVIRFTPSFNIKTTDKRVEHLLRTMEVEAFDPWEMRMRTVKATKSLRDAYILLETLRVELPKLEVEFEEAPEVPSSLDQGTDESPVTH